MNPIRITLYRNGDWLCARAHVRGSPKVYEAKANLREIARVLYPYFHASIQAHVRKAAAAGALPGGVPGGPVYVGSFWSKITKPFKKAINKLAHLKIVRDIGKAAKGFLKLPAISAAIHAAAAAFPPLGVPALVAFKAANAAIALAEKGGPALQQFRNTIKRLQVAARGVGPLAEKARKTLKVLKVTNNWRRGLQLAARKAQGRVHGVGALPAVPSIDRLLAAGVPPGTF